MTRALVVAVVVAGLGAACRRTPPHATALDAERANIELAALEEGRALMIRKCGNCHRPPLPTEHTAGEWPVMLDEMSERANLDTRQRTLIEKYLVTLASR
jgi:hypothetical protein